MKREIYEAYEALTPGEAEREAMLRSILARASAPPPEGRETMKRKPLIRLLPVAAVVALLLALSVTAYATGWFGLGALGETVTPQTQGFTKEEIAARDAALQEAVAKGEDPVKALEALDGQDFPRPVENVRIISLQGLADAPEAQACLEYLDFLAGIAVNVFGRVVSFINFLLRHILAQCKTYPIRQMIHNTL